MKTRWIPTNGRGFIAIKETEPNQPLEAMKTEPNQAPEPAHLWR